VRSIKCCAVSREASLAGHGYGEYHEFDHDGQIKDLLIDLSIESRFTKTPTGAKQTCQAVHFNQHPTHYILVVLYLGYEDRKENGYRPWCLPKKKYSLEQFMEFSKRLLSTIGEQILGASVFLNQPGNPSN